MNPVNLKHLLREEIAYHFWNQDKSIPGVILEKPFDLYQKISNCPRTITFPLAPDKGRAGRGALREGDGSRVSRRQRILAGFKGKLQTSRQTERSGSGILYVVEDFPIFDRHFPDLGIAVGKGEGLHWIRPVRTEFKDFQSDGFSPGDELTCSFILQFRDGLRGRVGYMDRIKSSGRFSRWHIYPCGDIISADLYPDHRLKHDLFRTLMAYILYGETHPECYEGI
ncbi:MAG: hypothetical protein JRJ78_15975 [Deltaproteobacteria bacterium]|nr:hypothetical protein [Deltaproteobacteria bacterium]